MDGSREQQIDDADFGATPTLFNGVIGGQSVPLVGAINKDGIFYAFKRDAVSSGPVWQTRIATGGGDPTTGHGPDAPAAFDGTTLYVGGDNTSGCSGTVNALNPSTGAFIWKRCFTDGGFVDDAVTVTSGGVVVVGEGNNIRSSQRRREHTVHLQHRRRGLGSSLRRRQHAVRRRHRRQPLRAYDQLAAGATRWVCYAVVRGQPVIAVLVAAGFAVAACGGGSGSVGSLE